MPSRSINKDGVAIAMVENANEAVAIADRAYILVDGKNSRTETRRSPPRIRIRKLSLGG